MLGTGFPSADVENDFLRARRQQFLTTLAHHLHAPWEARDIPVASDLLRASLGRAVAATSQLLLVALWCRQRRRGFKGRRGQDPVKAAREPGHWTVTAQLTRPCFSR